MKILVVFTGGTIGSSTGEKWISLDQATSFTLLENYKKDNDASVNFEVLNPYSILSENLSGKELTALSKLINQKVKEGYDGIVITHGTDTIQYTAAALSFVVDTDIPVLLVSANYPLENPLSNGNANFKGAVDFIINGGDKGVFVAYQNPNDKKVNIHLGSRLISHLEAKDELFSIDAKPYAEINDGKIIRFSAPIVYNVLKENVSFNDFSKILVVSSIPGDCFSYNLDGIEATILKPYHSGTLNTENPKLIDFCNSAKAKNIPVILINEKDGTSYESTKGYGELGITAIPSSTLPSVYVKTWLAISLGKDVKSFLQKELAGEFTKLN